MKKIVFLIFLLIGLKSFSQKLPNEFFADMWVDNQKKCELIGEAWTVEGGFYIAEIEEGKLSIFGFNHSFEVISVELVEDDFYRMDCYYLSGNKKSKKTIFLKVLNDKLLFKEGENIVEYIKCSV